MSSIITDGMGGAYGGGFAAYNQFVPDTISGNKAAFTYNPSGAIDGAPITPKVPKANSGVVTDGTSYGKGAPYKVRTALFDAILRIRTELGHIAGTVDRPTMLGISPPDSIPSESTIGSVKQFYVNDGNQSMLAFRPNNNALVGVYTVQG